MFKMKSYIPRLSFIVAFAVVATPAWAYQDVPQVKEQSAPSPTIVVTGKKNADPNKKICKGGTPTGSLMRRFTCKTNSEWAALAERSGAALDLAKRDQTMRDFVQIQMGKR